MDNAEIIKSLEELIERIRSSVKSGSSPDANEPDRTRLPSEVLARSPALIANLIVSAKAAYDWWNTGETEPCFKIFRELGFALREIAQASKASET